MLYLICDDNIIEDKLPDLVNVEVFSEGSQTFHYLFCTRSGNWPLRDHPHWVTIWQLLKLQVMQCIGLLGALKPRLAETVEDI